MATQFLCFDIELDHPSARARDAPEIRDLAAGPAADEENKIRFCHGPIGTVTRIGTRDAHGKPMVFPDRSLRI